MADMTDQVRAWDAEYRAHGRMWRGPGDIDDIIKYLPQGGRVLDLGCGNGKTLKALERAGYDVVGMDFSIGGLSQINDNPSLLLSDIRHLPLKQGFEGVVAYHVLENIIPDEIRTVMDEIWSTLLPGGYLFLKVFTTEDMRAKKKTRGAGIRYHYYDLDEVRDLLKGYEIKELVQEQKEKRYRNKCYKRSWIRAVAKKV